MAEDENDKADSQTEEPSVSRKKAEVLRQKRETYLSGAENASFSWHAVAQTNTEASHDLDNFMSNRIEFGGKNLENGKFAHENFENANFSVANLKGVDFSGANLKGVDFSGADLTDANLSGADLTGAVLSNAVLKHTNFTGAILNGVVLTDADLDNAILLDIRIDEIGLEDLQELIEYLAKYAPHKLNLAKMNLTMLNLAKIDLKNVNLRGVDFTGCDFTGVNIMELDLSECIITPAQIAQALGRVPNAEELKRLMAPKVKNGSKKERIDISSFFLDDGREAGVWYTLKDKGISTQKLVDMVKAGHKVYRRIVKRPEGNKEAEKIKAEKENQISSSTEELHKVLEDNKRALIEKHKQEELEARRQKKLELEMALAQSQEEEKTPEQKDVEKQNVNPMVAERISAFKNRSRD